MKPTTLCDLTSPLAQSRRMRPASMALAFASARGIPVYTVYVVGLDTSTVSTTSPIDPSPLARLTAFPSASTSVSTQLRWRSEYSPRHMPSVHRNVMPAEMVRPASDSQSAIHESTPGTVSRDEPPYAMRRSGTGTHDTGSSQRNRSPTARR